MPFSTVGRAGRDRRAFLLDEDRDIPQTTWPPGTQPTARPWGFMVLSLIVKHGPHSGIAELRVLWRVTSRARAMLCCPRPRDKVEKPLSLPTAPDPGHLGKRCECSWHGQSTSGPTSSAKPRAGAGGRHHVSRNWAETTLH